MSISDGVLANAANFNAAFESKNKTVVSKTGDYTATSSDYQINCDASGGSFTITLPAAASNSGLILSIKKTDSSLTNSVTIDGNSSETINGSTTRVLRTQYEEIHLICNGTSWDILSRYIPLTWTSFTPTVTTSSGTMTNYTATGSWMRIGGLMYGRFAITFSGAAGTWTDPLIAIPSSLTYDTTNLRLGGNGASEFGHASYEDTGTQSYFGSVQWFSSNRMLMTARNTGGSWSSQGQVASTTPFSFASGDSLVGCFLIPINGWEG